MKVVILAGGLGTRLVEETEVKPKPMVEVGGQPMLWHIMKIYAASGYKEFVVAVGYRGGVIKEYFLDYHRLNSSVSISLATGAVEVHESEADDWQVHLVDTGLETQTGGRLKRLAPWVGGETFLMTYGDGVASVDVSEVVAFHRSHGRLATILAVRPPARFGSMTFDGDLVSEFIEKPQLGEGWINGGFFVLEPEVMDYIEGDETAFEGNPLDRLAKNRQLVAFRHEGFWQCMDTMRDVRLLNRLWESGDPPWRH